MREAEMNNFPRLPKPPTGWPKLPEIITPAGVVFLGAQDEATDEEYKRRMSRLFAQLPKIVRRAYLVRLAYDDSPAVTVVLCTRYMQNIERELTQGFRHMFGEIHRRGDSYDTMIIDEAQEQALNQVCKPFYQLA